MENVCSKMIEHISITDGDGKKIINRKENNKKIPSKMESSSRIKGFFKIIDKDTGEIIVDKTNAIHYENMSYAIANSLVGADGISSYLISYMYFGNGGCVVNGTGDITYLPPNVTGTNATLYNQTYSQYIGQSNVMHLNGKTYSDIIMTTTLSYGLVSSQSAFDNGTTFDDSTFSEIGLVTTSGLLLTHCVFSPIQKSTNRSFVITYTLRISMV